VGLHVRESGLGVTLAERRSGGTWTVQSTLNPAEAAASALNGVSWPSSSACTGGGQFVTTSGAQRTLAEHWNGRDWRSQPPADPAGSPSSRLFAVSCPAAGTCTAAGTANSKGLVGWGGGAPWRTQPAPVPPRGPFRVLDGGTCTTATASIAGGDLVDDAGAHGALGR